MPTAWKGNSLKFIIINHLASTTVGWPNLNNGADQLRLKDLFKDPYKTNHCTCLWQDRSS